MDSRREFIKKSVLLSGAAGWSSALPASVQKAFAIDPAPGSTYLDAEHIVVLMQENRSFDHCFGSLQGVRGFNDPRAIFLPDKKPVWLQTNAQGETYAPFRLDIKDTKTTWMGDLPHSRASQVDAWNEGKYDQWLTAKRSNNKGYANMPLTLGYYTRQDLPFNYGMADAFTICDQNFSSAMTSTTPNRSFFMTGKITSEEQGLPKANIRNNDFSYTKMPWKTFPELLEENNIAWKFYQNELDCGGGFTGDERAWLSNFGCNLLEFFAAFNVKFAPRYIKNLQRLADELPGEINRIQELSPTDATTAEKNKAAVTTKQAVLDNAVSELKKWNKETFDQLPAKDKQLFHNAFVVNDGDPSYRSVSRLKYTAGDTDRELTVPAGDILYQFRKDVQEGKLPTVSWFAGPQNFSDHPSAPWYGAWYVSEVLDILTKNPEVWKKTIVIFTYDENDGYFDHIPPFSIPDNNKQATGKCSAGIETEIEHVRMAHEVAQGVPQKQAREAAVGLGYRVPMIIASPWSRGGKVCSQVFDHTSTLQFLENFVNNKFKKNIRLDNISQWRRTICGDLTAAFSPFNGKPPEEIPFLQRDVFVEGIYNAKFKEAPGGFKKITAIEMEEMVAKQQFAAVLPSQEKGTRPSVALPYEIVVDSKLSDNRKHLELRMAVGKQLFGGKSAGVPFTVTAPGKYTGDGGASIARNWSFAVAAGDTITYQWPLAAFENNGYHLHLNGPNGFYRECRGIANDPLLLISCGYDLDKKSKSTGSLLVQINNQQAAIINMRITDNAYGNKMLTRQLATGTHAVTLPTGKTHGWYDFSITVDGHAGFEKRYAGRVETGKESISDPLMGQMI
ncbi:MAG: phospholipase C, phosphocholine-specific [Chitinophagaceae bacterium]